MPKLQDSEPHQSSEQSATEDLAEAPAAASGGFAGGRASRVPEGKKHSGANLQPQNVN